MTDPNYVDITVSLRVETDECKEAIQMVEDELEWIATGWPTIKSVRLVEPTIVDKYK